MFSSRPLHLLALIALLLGSGTAPAWCGPPAGQAIAVSIDDFSYLDTSGEPTDQTAAHRARLQAFMAALRSDVAADQRFRLVASNDAGASNPSAEDRLHAAAQAGAKILITGGVQKLSTLIQWARAVAIDTASHRVVYQKLYTFRGDNDEAWQRAEAFVSGDIRTALAGQPPAASAGAAAPVSLAVFDFELEDTSAAAATTGETASDARDLADVTGAVRQLLAQSARYRLVDVTGADAAKTHALRDCDGCDVTIARQLGADQSLVGVVRRISRTEYTLRFQVRDSRSGAVVASADSGLRMGANYSWSRGAVQLVRDHLLATAQQ